MFQDLDPQWAKNSQPLWEDEPMHSEPQEEMPPQDLLDSMLAEYDAIKDTSDPASELASIVRYRVRLATELERVKKNMEAMIYAAEQQLARCDQMHQARAEELTKQLMRGKSKSVKTPYGVAGFRTRPATVEVLDPQDVPAEFKRQVVTEKIDKAKINEAFKKDGLVPAGCEPVAEQESFYIK